MIQAYLYDANGEDHEVDLAEGKLPKLNKDQLLWLDLAGREKDDLAELGRILCLKEDTLAEIEAPGGPPLLNNYGEYFHLSVLSVCAVDVKSGGVPPVPKGVRLDMLVGKEWIATIADQELPFLKQFRDRDRGETMIGVLSSGSLAASLLDWHLTGYHEALEALESYLDRLDVRLLGGRPIDQTLLRQVVDARRYVARLRRNLAPQRLVFFGLARPDFSLVADSEAREPFHALGRRFERVLDAIEHSRELVQGSFDLYSAQIAESTNVLIRRLTFLSLALGGIGAVAGIFGMNFQTRYTDTGELGFWMVVGSLTLLVGVLSMVSRLRKWI